MRGGDVTEGAMLSIVAPVFNEARILPELVARCRQAAEQCGMPFEIVLADDASTDATAAVLAELTRDGRVRHCRLPSNAGQFGATQYGLRAARGTVVAVLDGDLQDPPELVPRLVAALATADPSVVAVFAVKASRDDPAGFMLGQFVFHILQKALSRVALPPGAGSYCVMRRPVAQRVAHAALKRANISAVVAVTAAAMGGTLASLPYDKAARYDDTTRVGWRGLILEALESLELTGALSRLLGLLAVLLAVAGLVTLGAPLAARGLFTASVAVALLGLWVGGRARRALASVRSAHESR